MTKNFQLVDLAWELGVTAASSCEEQVGQTYVRIKMKLNTGSSLETTVMELSLKQFYDLLHELEKAQNNMK
ncbi:hypothetical protein DAPPUDRAFT_306363 [Daphnia pulex]|uniref:COMM domain-containing protein n=1 Tax=Daphnia pulex TaxID=6669 RepID=E9FY82_DAPPU|nr:hypothetical protein DAPPUDRAFT_306363 [Daphnia pulex]|eukprot:EFX87822.1 hypothetical protein DAPPUDRAFT_306363 [Daphnia pulex]